MQGVISKGTLGGGGGGGVSHIGQTRLVRDWTGRALVSVQAISTQVSLLCLINPFSHYILCVSRLTALRHMRHPLKADLGKNEDNFCAFECVRPPDQGPQNNSKQSRGGEFSHFSL
jgi:hypothetical protein